MYEIEINPLIDDPYTIKGYDRDTIKLASLVLLNSENIPAFKACITKSGNPANKAVMAEYTKDYELFIKRSSKGLPHKQPLKPKIAKGFIFGMPDNVEGEHLYKSITERHSVIAGLFGTEKIGGFLQNCDSRIMADTLTTLAKQGIPALPVHDSVRVKISDHAEAVKAMKEAYFKETGLNCVITG